VADSGDGAADSGDGVASKVEAKPEGAESGAA
jgi:hypothetical protein